MRKVDRLLGGIKLARLKKFASILPKTRKHWENTLSYAAQNREKIEQLLPGDFAWSPLYELDAKHLFILNLAALGELDKVLQAHREGKDLNQFFMEESIREAENPDGQSEWSGGHGGLFTQADVFAISYATQASRRCVEIYGHYLNELVEQVRGNKDPESQAFFHAVSIDRTVLSCPTFAARLSRAEFFGDKRFMLRLRKAVKGKPHDALLQHLDLKALLQLFYEMRTLSNFGLDDADLLFIRELKVYQTSGRDPARSLMRFIQRWAAEKKATT